MINLDSEEEGIFLTSCAGGARVHYDFSLDVRMREGYGMEVVLGGLQGGHSGGEIHKERGNSNLLMGRLLYRLAKRMPLSLLEAAGGLADNAIPRETRAVLVIEEKDKETFEEVCREVEQEIQTELATKDPGVYIRTSSLGEGKFLCVTTADTCKAATILNSIPNGVQAMSADMPGLVETSLNLGILEVREGSLRAEFSVRSSVESAKKALIDRLCAVAGLAEGKVSVTGDYPGWKFRKNSPLRDKMVALYKRMYGIDPKVEAIHAGLECGILGSKIKDLDCVSIGPQMTAIHTTEERLCISSTRRVWEYLVNLLQDRS